MNLGTKESCSCDSCENACKHKPGWFGPGEAEKAAELMRMTLEDFFVKFLIVDWNENNETGETKEVFVLSPGIKGKPTGEEAPSFLVGECVFYNADSGQCRVHAAKPFECREYLHGQDDHNIKKTQDAVTKAWDSDAFQQQIKTLLGRKPKSKPFNYFELMVWLGKRRKLENEIYRRDDTKHYNTQ